MMQSSIHAVTVYCSSSKQLDAVHYAAGKELGKGIAEARWDLVYGGNHVGLMGTLADAAREAGGRVIGITPQIFVDKGFGDSNCDELIVTAGLRERKGLMEERGDAFIALPGGLGTFEEIFDIIVHRQLGYHDKPIVLVNIDGYYDCLLRLVENGVEQHFIKIESRQLFITASSVESALSFLRSYPITAPKPVPADPAAASAAE